MEKYKRDNFAVLVNRLSILQFSSQLSILGGAGKRSCWGVLVIFERPSLLTGAIFFDAVKTCC